MKEYIVKVPVRAISYRGIQANSKREALELATDESTEFDLEIIEELPQEEWEVIEEEDLF
jgi:hypothetical protein